jgi:hypothetical protein
VPAGQKQKNEVILVQESWGLGSHQRFPEVEFRKNSSLEQKKAISYSKSKDESLIIQKSSQSQNSEASPQSSEKLSNCKIFKISEQEPANYDKTHNPIINASIFFDNFSIDADRERINDKQATEIQKTVVNGKSNYQNNLSTREAFTINENLSPWSESAAIAVKPPAFNPTKCSFNSWEEYQRIESEKRLIKRKIEPQISIESKLKFGLPLFFKPEPAPPPQKFNWKLT